MLNKVKIIALSAGKDIAEGIAEELGLKVYPSSVIRFADGELIFEGKESIRGYDCYIIQSTCNPVNENLMELLFCIDACKRASARTINCVIPYFGYARQDRLSKPRQSLSAKVVSDLIEHTGANRIMTLDIHVPQIQGFFNIPFDEATPLPYFAKYIKDKNLTNLVCVSTDHGGVARTSKLASLLNCPIAIIDKRRPEPNKSEIIGIVGDVKDRTCIVVDDIADTAGTLCNAANKLADLGAKEVYAAVTHALLSKDAVEKINASAIKEMLITNSIPLPENKKSDKFVTISIAKFFAAMIKATVEGTSMAEVYEGLNDLLK